MLKMLLVQRKTNSTYISVKIEVYTLSFTLAGYRRAGGGVGCPGGGRRPNDNGGLIAATSTEQIKPHGAPIIGL